MDEYYNVQVSLVDEKKAESYIKSSCFKHIFEVNYLAHFWTEIISNWNTNKDKELIAMKHEMLEWLRIMIESGTLVSPYDRLPEARPLESAPPIDFELHSREGIRCLILDALSAEDPVNKDKTLRDIYAKKSKVHEARVQEHLSQAIHGMEELGLSPGEAIRRQLIKALDYPVEPVNTTTTETQIVSEDILTDGQSILKIKNQDESRTETLS